MESIVCIKRLFTQKPSLIHATEPFSVVALRGRPAESVARIGYRMMSIITLRPSAKNCNLAVSTAFFFSSRRPFFLIFLSRNGPACLERTRPFRGRYLPSDAALTSSLCNYLEEDFSKPPISHRDMGSPSKARFSSE